MNCQLASDIRQIQSQIKSLSRVLDLVTESIENPDSELDERDHLGVLQLVAGRLVDSADDLSIIAEGLEVENE